MNDLIFGLATYSVIILGIVILFLVLSMTRLRVMPYLYSNARLSARSKFLLKLNKLKNVAEAKSLTDFCSNISETDYHQNIERKNNLKDIHKSIEKTFFLEIKELMNMTPKQIRPLFEVYMVFTESKIIKSIYRKRFKRQKIIIEDFPNIGIFTKGLLDKVAHSESIADLKVVFSNTLYGPVFENDFDTPLEFEKELDNFILEKFLTEINKTKIYDKKIIVELLKIKLDTQNVLMILKSIARDEDSKKRLEFSRGTIFEKLAKSNTIEEFIDNAKGLPFKKAIDNAFDNYKHDKSFFHFEISLLRYYKELLEKNDILHYQGPFPIFSYLAKKEIEKTNLFAISKGIDAGFKSKDIMEMVV